MVNLPPFQRLLDDHAVDLHRFCVAQVGPHAGPDCFQEAVLAALRAYPTLTDASNLRGWLYTIAHRKVIDHHRAERRRPAPSADLPEVQTSSPSVDHDVWAEVARLPDKQRGAIALRYLADLPYAQIGLALDCSEAAARQNVRAGLSALRMEVNR